MYMKKIFMQMCIWIQMWAAASDYTCYEPDTITIFEGIFSWDEDSWVTKFRQLDRHSVLYYNPFTPDPISQGFQSMICLF